MHFILLFGLNKSKAMVNVFNRNCFILIYCVCQIIFNYSTILLSDEVVEKGGFSKKWKIVWILFWIKSTPQHHHQHFFWIILIYISSFVFGSIFPFPWAIGNVVGALLNVVLVVFHCYEHIVTEKKTYFLVVVLIKIRFTI